MVEFLRRIAAKHPWIVLEAAALAFVIGLFAGSAGNTTPAGSGEAANGEQKISFWTCSMHPQVKKPEFGLCPICNMDLIPVYDDGSTANPRELVIDEAAKRLAEIRTSPVERRFVAADVRMVGKVAYDETRVRTITAWVSGRLDRLFVDYTGVTVKRGDHMVYMYSPEVLVAEAELLEAVRAVQQASTPSTKASAQDILDAAREKLRLWGFENEQIAEIEKRGKASDHITINSPVSGIVIDKMALEGMYVKTGTPIYKITDLSQLWVLLDAYESDLPWLRYGQEVTFTTQAVPGEVFTGRIAFIDPTLDPKSRTVKVRVNVANPNFKLKPEMFVRAVVRSTLAKAGKVVDPKLAGKWISPMHPEIVKDQPGSCDICGMPLVRAETLFDTAAQPSEAPLVVPASAVLLTGTRAVVYVEVPEREKPTFEGRVVRVGPRAGDHYIIKDGLKEGERVVTNGNFKIDSALQIMAKQSMMSMESGGIIQQVPEEEAAAGLDVSAAFLEQWDALLKEYLVLQDALAKDDATAAEAQTERLLKALDAVDMKLVEGDAHMAWMKTAQNLKEILKKQAAAKGLQRQRESFALLSEELLAGVKAFGHALEQPLDHVHCGMAFDNRGAAWLQNKGKTRNPYFGAEMLSCGDVEESFAPKGAKGAKAPKPEQNAPGGPAESEHQH